MQCPISSRSISSHSISNHAPRDPERETQTCPELLVNEAAAFPGERCSKRVC